MSMRFRYQNDQRIIMQVVEGFEGLMKVEIASTSCGPVVQLFSPKVHIEELTQEVQRLQALFTTDWI